MTVFAIATAHVDNYLSFAEFRKGNHEQHRQQWQLQLQLQLRLQQQISSVKTNSKYLFLVICVCVLVTLLRGSLDAHQIK